MNWKTAKVKLRLGERITRPNWEPNNFWQMSRDGYERILCHDGTNAVVHLKQIESEDWGLWFKEERIKCFWCEKYVTNLVEHTNNIHPGLSPRSYDFIKEKRC